MTRSARGLAAGLTRRDRWSPQAARLLVYLLIVIQLAQSAFRPPDGFTRSYWLVTYDEGFIRRGLTGSVLAALSGPATDTSVQVASAVVAVVCVASVLLVVELLLRRCTSATVALAVLLAASPFVIDQFMLQRRPDQLGIPVLVLLGVGLIQVPSRRAELCAITGLLFGALCLVHEGTALYNVPVALALLLVVTRPTASLWMQARLAALLLVPSAVALGAVLLSGQPSPAAVARLRAAAPIRLTGPTMFDFLGDSAASSLRLVADYPKVGQAAMLALGVGLLAVHWVWLSRETGPELLRRTYALVPRVLGAATLAVIALGAGLTFALGVDWLRWVAELGCAWLVATAVLYLEPATPRTATGPAPTGAPLALPRWLVAVAFYLALLPPLSQSLGVRGIISFILLGL